MSDANRFPNTTWGMVCKLRDPGLSGCRDGFETLARRYWEPVCSYVSVEWSIDSNDAQDLTQDFFVWLAESAVLKRYLPERGSFRNFLKGLLRNFRHHKRRAASAAKRGGGKAPLPLDHDGAPEPIDPRAAAAEEAFDRAWKDVIARRAIERVRKRIGPEAVRWRAFEGYDLVPQDKRPTYESLGESLGVKASQVRNYLYAIREEIREEARVELGGTVTTPEELAEEWSHFVAG